jgi:hypothetical protein
MGEPTVDQLKTWKVIQDGAKQVLDWTEQSSTHAGDISALAATAIEARRHSAAGGQHLLPA